MAISFKVGSLGDDFWRYSYHKLIVFKTDGCLVLASAPVTDPNDENCVRHSQIADREKIGNKDLEVLGGAEYNITKQGYLSFEEYSYTYGGVPQIVLERFAPELIERFRERGVQAPEARYWVLSTLKERERAKWKPVLEELSTTLKTSRA